MYHLYCAKKNKQDCWDSNSRPPEYQPDTLTPKPLDLDTQAEDWKTNHGRPPEYQPDTLTAKPLGPVGRGVEDRQNSQSNSD